MFIRKMSKIIWHSEMGKDKFIYDSDHVLVYVPTYRLTSRIFVEWFAWYEKDFLKPLYNIR